MRKRSIDIRELRETNEITLLGFCEKSEIVFIELILAG